MNIKQKSFMPSVKHLKGRVKNIMSDSVHFYHSCNKKLDEEITTMNELLDNFIQEVEHIKM